MTNKFKRFLFVVISIIWFLILKVKTIINCLTGKGVPGRFIILYYHDIPECYAKRFAAQMNILKKMSTVVSAAYNGPLRNSTIFTAITFDDGFSSVLENAIPILCEKGIEATIFIPTGSMGRKPLWIKNPKDPRANERVLSEDDCRNLPSDLITIGSHCVSHKNLIHLDSKNAQNEIVESKQYLEDILKHSIRLLSFPHGSFSSEMVHWAKDCGFERVFSIEPNYALQTPDEFVTGRFAVNPSDSLLEFRLKILGAFGWQSTAFALKRIVIKLIGLKV